MNRRNDMRRGLRVALAGLVLLGVALAAGVAGLVWQHYTEDEPLAQGNRKEPPGFRECAVESGITFQMNFLPTEQGERFKFNLYDHGCGVAVGDYDGDGHDDLYFLNQLGANALFRNKGDGTFTDVTEQAGVALDDRICVGATFADYDNDGRQDLYVTSTRGGNVLFRNLGGGRFDYVTEEADLTLVAHSQTAAFFDYDKDGFLDLFVSNTAQWTLDQFDDKLDYYPGVENIGRLATAPKEHNVFYRNNGDGTFTDVTRAAGLEGEGWGGDVAVFDFDGDGWLDLLVTNMFGASQLYRNDGAGAFDDVTRVALQRTPWGAIGAKVFDHDNDGKLDLFIVDMHSDMWGRAADDADSLAVARKYATVKHDGVTGPYAVTGAKRSLSQAERIPARMFQIRYDAVFFGNGFYKNQV
jgi:enediyne biosynthesis protein E4